MSELIPIEACLLDGEVVAVAPRLLNLVLVHGDRAGRIVEVEAYGGSEDPASHAFRGRRTRHATMFGRAGLCYVYFTYGMHHCANVVCGPVGRAAAVLVRAVEPVAGVDAWRDGRPARVSDERLGAGPARLCRSLAITAALDGADLLDPASPLRLMGDGRAAPSRPLRGERIGLSVRAGSARAWRWRFAVPGSPAISVPIRPGPSTPPILDRKVRPRYAR